MTPDETTAALLALFYASRARHGHGTRRNDKRVRRKNPRKGQAR